MHKTLHPRDDVNGLCQEKKKVASMNRYKDPKSILKSAEEDWLQQLETIQTTQASTEQKEPENKNGKSNNCIDISRDKQVKFHLRKLGHG